jgi:hypothetical protein
MRPNSQKGIPKNKSVIGGKFYVLKKRGPKAPRFITHPPQIHHQNATFFRLILPKPPAKHHNRLVKKESS